MPDSLLDQVIKTLTASKASMRCDEVVKLLKDLGFNVRDGKCPGHKIFTHPELQDFHSGSFNCDHGKNPQIKSAYISKILRVLSDNETALNAIGEKQ